ncbi:Adhesion G-protein coupled receptor D1 [Bulinus truncatus]|nr:Adhesion G-protein coupled receptor D1 [Bulinus truncatus]
MCRCQTQCQEDGSCSMCQPGWFGPKCEYVDLITSENAEIRIDSHNESTTDWLTDRNESTCSQVDALNITLTWNTSHNFKWSEMTFKNESRKCVLETVAALVGNVIVSFIENITRIECQNSSLSTVEPNVKYVCGTVSMNKMILTGDGINLLCGLYVSNESESILNTSEKSVNENVNWMSEVEILSNSLVHTEKKDFNCLISSLAHIVLDNIKPNLPTDKVPNDSPISPNTTDSVPQISIHETMAKTVLNVLASVGNMTSQDGYYVDSGSFERLVKLVDIVAPLCQDSWTQGNQGETISINALTSSLDIIVSRRLESNKTMDMFLELANIVVKIGTAHEDIRYIEGNETNTGQHRERRGPENEIFLSQDVFAHINTSTKYSIFMVKNKNKSLNYGTGDETSSETPTGKIVSDILTLSVSVPLTASFRPLVKLTFALSMMKYSRPLCVYLDMSVGPAGGWSADGCHTESIQDDRIVCSCDHLTSFAVLIGSVELQQHKTLSALTISGCSISIFCLIVTIVIYIVLWRHIKSERSFLILNLCISMLIGYLVFIIGIDKTETKMCTVFAVVLHYCFLLVFFNFLCQSLVLYKSIYDTTGKISTRMFLALMYGCPLIIVTITMAVTSLDGYGTVTHCWLSIDRGLIWAFIGPVIAVIFVNLIVLVLVIRVYLSTRTLMIKTRADRTLSVIRAIIFLVPLFGLTWVFGLLTVYTDHIVLQYLFVILNTFQGFFIYLFHCKNHPKIKEVFESLRKRKKKQEIDNIQKNTIIVSM